METMAIMGFIFGMSGASFGLMAFGQVSQLKKEVQKLKDRLEGE